MKTKQILKILIEFNFSNSLQDTIETEELDRANPELEQIWRDLLEEYKQRGANKYRSIVAYYDSETNDLNYMAKGTWIYFDGNLENSI